jgi:hypothetical protein
MKTLQVYLLALIAAVLLWGSDSVKSAPSRAWHTLTDPPPKRPRPLTTSDSIIRGLVPDDSLHTAALLSLEYCRRLDPKARPTAYITHINIRRPDADPEHYVAGADTMWLAICR